MQRRKLEFRAASVRPIAGLTLFCFLLASVGYPLWSAGEAKDLSKPFPCMYRKCGCRNAEQCWRGCCCFSGKQKLAWAKQNDVAPPEYVIAAAEHEPETPAKTSCCATKKSGACHVAKVSQPADTLTAAIEALTCMTHLDQWVAMGAIDVAQPALWQLELLLIGEVTFFTRSHSATASAPTPPPPWC